MTVCIGITGAIGCGKSTVAGWLAELGATIVDADQVARAVVEPGEPALADVLERFGPAVRAADGSLDRAALGRIVFADPRALATLEALLRPAIRARILAAMDASTAAAAPAVVVEAIRLVEGGLAALCDEIWLVTCEGAAQRARLEARGLAEGDAADRIAAQERLLEAARAVATRVIDTTVTPEETRAAVSAAYRAALDIARGT